MTTHSDAADLILHQPRANFGVPNPSPFCVKLETWLRMAEIPYRAVPVFDPSKGPKGKIPFVEFEGETIGDSEFIIQAISAGKGIDLDDGMGAEDRAVATAFTRMIEEHLYWAAIHARWLEPAPFEVLKKAFFGRLPFGVRQIAPGIVRRRLRRTLQGQGLGRHEPAEIYRKGARDLQALSDFLGTKPYLMGETPRTVDASAYGILTNIIDVDFDHPMKPIGRGFQNLVDYTARMREKYFADLGAKSG
ncbi:MAG: glutathione S-transferase family protein [Alphaproteobacteria bacterium]|nr:glutathione S-transferase family protein [Alphaproteobacteria bacterium]